MIKLLAPLLSLINLVATMWREHKLKQQGREEAFRDEAKEVEARIATAKAAIDALDPSRDERLRSRFDRSRSQ